jgi:hypothetical protein
MEVRRSRYGTGPDEDVPDALGVVEEFGFVA